MVPGGEPLEEKGWFINWYLRNFSGIRHIYFKVNHARRRGGGRERTSASVVLSNLPAHKLHVSISVHSVCLSLVVLATRLLHVDSAVWEFALGTLLFKFSIFGLGKTIVQHLKGVYLWFSCTWLLHGE